MAHIEQRPTGWRAQVRRKGGKSISRTFDLKADAEAWARELEREIQRGNVAVLRQDAQRVTVAALADAYDNGPVDAMKSCASVRTRLVAIRARFGAYFLGNVRGVDVAAWRDALLKDGLAPQSVIHHLNTLSALYSYAAKDLSIDLPAGNPVKAMRKPSMPRARDRRLRAGELDALLAAASVRGAAVGLPQIITLAVETSMRLGELISLEWSRVDLKRRTAHLVDTKNGESRTVALSTAAVQALDALPRRIDGRAFPWKTVSGFETIWQRCVKRARRDHLYALLRDRLTSDGVDTDSELRALIYKKREPSARTLRLLAECDRRSLFLADLRFHDLRHEATSRLFEKGLGIMEVASMTGHKSLAMLKRYTHVEAEKLAAKLG